MSPISDPILMFTLLALIMLAMPLLAERLKVPDMVLLLLAGTLLGPHGAGLLERNTAVTLFGSVGMLYIMFLAGLEIDLHRFSKTRGRSLTFGLLTFAIPQFFGTFAVHYLLGFNWQAAILLASMFASHTLLAYPVASRLGIARSEPVAISVGATIITDTLALLVLAVIADIAKGYALNAGFFLHIAIGLAILVALILWGIPVLSRWFFNNVTETGGAQFLFVLVTVCGFAYLSHFAKMEPIIGAFLAGAAFNRLIPEHSALMNRVVFAGHTIFIPFFLISVGMMVDPAAVISDPRSWMVAITMIVLVIITKYTAAWIAGMFFGYEREARKVMFGLSVVQAAATLAAVLVGFELKIFDETVLNGAIAMIAVTCPLGAWMVDRHGRHMAAQSQPPERSSLGHQNILVPVANPSSAVKMLEMAFLLRETARLGAIHALTVVRDAGDTEERIAWGEKLLADCLSYAASADTPVSPAVRIGINTPDGIVRAVKELHVEITIAGWGGSRTPSDRLFGSVMERLIDACPSRLVFCRIQRPLNTTRRILLLLPPLSARRSDLTLLLGDAKRLSRQIGAELRTYLAEKQSAPLRKRIEAARPESPVVFVESANLVAARTRLLADIREDDLTILLGERQNSFLWTPTLDKMATLVAAKFPDNNLLLIYPAFASYHEDELSITLDPDADKLRIHPCELSAVDPLEKVLRQMVRQAFSDNRAAAAETLQLLRVAAKSYPVELSPGTVLLHAHCELISNPILIVGRGCDGCRFPALKNQPRLLLTLLNPTSSSPERHLKTLADLGKRFRNPQTAAAIREAHSAAEITALLS
ncbi:MAG: cation:proton antiporter [Kiritimatiellae bacterium]|nr:cation:proton antiporter [Kiritimatiellia bacterium]